MKLQDNLIELRKQKGYSQEELAYQLGVSRQSVSKWESGLSTPELDRLVEIADLYKVSLDELVRGEKPEQKEFYISDEQLTRIVRKSREYEYKSKFTIFGVPLIHVNIGRGRKVAKGIFAFGNIAIGIFALGGIGIGLIGLGGIGMGLLAIGGLSIGGLSFGGVSIGIVAVGGFAMGVYSIGGFAVATEVAVGGRASGFVAIGASPSGQYIIKTSGQVNTKEVYDALSQLPVTIPEWIKGLISIY
ncbi:MAG: helix-turn-helix transcriptional regulator [Coprobacillus sp.]